MTERRYSPLAQLILARLREFYREPEALFWMYGFPVVMVIALGIAFRNQPVQQVAVDIVEGPLADSMLKSLVPEGKNSATEPQPFKALVLSDAQARTRLRTGKTDVVVSAESTAASAPHYEYFFDPTRPQSILARNAVDDQLQRAAGRRNVAEVKSTAVDEPGGRYIDFLVPGLLGMGLMSGGMWGVGFVIVDMRIRKLLKRFLATPMKKWQFLWGMMISRMLFAVPEVLLLLVFSRYAFGVVNQGTITAVATVILLGAVMFTGLGLLIASRANTIEAVTGLMNLFQLPMWVLSGIFFSSERFPEVMQPFIRILPLTPMIDALRAIMLEGATLVSQWQRLGVMAAWSAVSFTLALLWFRWR